MTRTAAPARRTTFGAGRILAVGALAMALGISWVVDGWAQGQCHSTKPYYWGTLPGQNSQSANCISAFWCYQPVAGEPSFRLEPLTCDPSSTSCIVQLVVPLEFPGAEDMWNEYKGTSYPSPFVFWFDEPTAGSCPTGFPPPTCSPLQDVTCGVPGFNGRINRDYIETWVEKPGINCANALDQTGDYAVRAAVCASSGISGCRKDVLVEGMTFDTPLLAIQIGCEIPPPKTCADPSEGTCPLCREGVGPDGGGPASGPGGGPGGHGPTGPGATLYYRAGGVGHPGFPGTSAWNTELGRYWSHTYAKRIVIDPGTGTDAHVWLLTEYGTFHEFKDLVGGVYTTVRPSNEYRTLERTSGWELTELDGTVHTFDSGGRWTQSVDRNGNETVATYTSGELTLVEFPDGREEELTYSSGRLSTITEIGVDGTSELEWTYTWTGQDLTRIDRPDGTALEYTYGDANFPGYVTLVELIPTSGSARILRAYDYDIYGNVVDMWAGATSPTDPDAVDRWQYSFDIPQLPSETEVTDPLGDVSTYVIGRDGSSTRLNSLMPKVISISGDCPTCGVGPNVQYEYGDPDHPLRPTRMLDGNGNDTRYEYTDEGEISVRIEAFGTSLERTTEWDYDATFPALVIEERRPSVTGGTNERVTTWTRDSVGNATTVTIYGFENGSAFSYDTDTTFNDDSDGGGQPSSVDPPGYGTSDVTSFTYHSRGNGNLILASRTDPLIGDTDYGYDAFNRRARETDPNGVAMDTRYDDLDRVTHRIHRVTDSLPVTPPDPPETIQTGDLVTEHVYNAYGDLDHTILPEGNVVDYEYDDAGRLISIERRPDLSNHGERQLFTLDDAGNRTRVDLQSWSGSAWVTRSFTIYHYDTRCHLDRVEDADGEITEYAYDCNGNLEKVWDAKHPSSGQTAPAVQVYDYDELNRLTSVTQPWAGSGGGNAVTSYDYDVQDHLVEVTDAEGNVTAYVYSDRDLLTAEASEFLATGGSCGTFPDCSQNGCGCTRKSYNEHGELIETTDPRGVTVERTVDELDRVTLVEYPDSSLDTQYDYDSGSFGKGRLSEIVRHTSHSFGYDRFGRMLFDGWVQRTYDENGNPVTVTAAAVGESAYTYDHSDRPVTLELDVSGNTYPIVTAATYEPFGPLTSLTLGNGVVEDRGYDDRYLPVAITAEDTNNTITLLDWDYTIDEVGNVTEIGDLLGTDDREFTYQDVHYFLTCAAGGAWAPGATCSPVASNPLQWTYDRIGNRLQEVRAGTTTSYTYAANGASGNTPLLTAVGGDDYDYDAAGNLIEIDRSPGGNILDYAFDDEGRVAGITNSNGESADLLYDGRSFLGLFDRDISSVRWGIQPRYSSDGLLRALVRQRNYGSPVYDADHFEVLYFAGRPVAVAALEPSTSSTPRLAYYTTDHLGTPILVTDDNAAVVWDNGFEPFGADPTKDTALKNGVFLRLPGQWADTTWTGLHLDSLQYYNVHRWYQFGTGRYGRVDPGLAVAGPINTPNLYPVPGFAFAYAGDNPVALIDPYGLTLEQALCVLKYTLVGIPVGGLTGIAAGCAAGATVGVFAGGVGALPGCGAAAVSGGIIGGAIGGVTGAIYGTTQCRCPAPKQRKRDRWTCEAKCHVNNFSGVPGAPQFVFGTASGSSETEACQAAISATQQMSPRGTYTRHCRCTNCWKR